MPLAPASVSRVPAARALMLSAATLPSCRQIVPPFGFELLQVLGELDAHQVVVGAEIGLAQRRIVLAEVGVDRHDRDLRRPLLQQVRHQRGVRGRDRDRGDALRSAGHRRSALRRLRRRSMPDRYRGRCSREPASSRRSPSRSPDGSARRTGCRAPSPRWPGSCPRPTRCRRRPSTPSPQTVLARTSSSSRPPIYRPATEAPASARQPGYLGRPQIGQCGSRVAPIHFAERLRPIAPNASQDDLSDKWIGRKTVIH